MSWLRICAAILCLGVVPAAMASPQPVQAPQSPPLFYGHWCGAGDFHRAGAVDAFDKACRAHDLCYEKSGRGACACDRAFLKTTARLIADPRTDEHLRAMVATANSLFSAVPCIEKTAPHRQKKDR